MGKRKEPVGRLEFPHLAAAPGNFFFGQPWMFWKTKILLYLSYRTHLSLSLFGTNKKHRNLDIDRKLIGKGLNKFIPHVELESVRFFNNHSLDIRINQVFWYLEFFTKNIELSIATNKSDKNNISIRNVIQIRNFGIRRKGNWFIGIALCKLIGGFPFKATIVMMPIMEPLKCLTLAF